MLEAKVTLSGASKLKRRIDHIGTGVREMLGREQLADFILRRIQERYLQETDPSGNRWRALSPNTKAGAQILLKKGNLFKQIGYIAGSNQGKLASATGLGFRIGIRPLQVVETSRNGVSRIVDPSVYGRVHQFGSGRVPQRRFLGISKLDISAVSKKVHRELRDLIEGGLV
jgi:phage gpG-like protein